MWQERTRSGVGEGRANDLVFGKRTRSDVGEENKIWCCWSELNLRFGERKRSGVARTNKLWFLEGGAGANKIWCGREGTRSGLEDILWRDNTVPPRNNPLRANLT